MKQVIVLIITTKIVLFLLIIAAFFLLPFAKGNYYINFHYPAQVSISLQTAFSTWDSQHYLYLAQKGYKLGVESDRFSPLLPGLIGIILPFIKNSIISGLIISNGVSCIGFIYFYLFVKDFTKNEKIALLSLFLLLIFPTGFYFSLIYSEALFLGIVMPLFYYLYKQKFLFASLCALLLPLTRPTGILILFPLFFFTIWYLQKNIKRRQHMSWGILGVLIAPLIGLGIYFLLMQKATGNPFTGLILQNDVVSRWRIDSLWHPFIFLHNLFPLPLAIHGFTNSLIDRLFFLGFLIALPFLWKKTDKILFVYACSLGLVPLFGSFMSYTRYMSVIFPVFLLLGMYFVHVKSRIAFFSYTYICIIFQTLFVIMHVLNYWVA